MPHLVSLYKDLGGSVFDVVELIDFKSRVNVFFLARGPELLSTFLSCTVLFLSLPSVGWLCAVWDFGLIGCIQSLPDLQC